MGKYYFGSKLVLSKRGRLWSKKGLFWHNEVLIPRCFKLLSRTPVFYIIGGSWMCLKWFWMNLRGSELIYRGFECNTLFKDSRGRFCVKIGQKTNDFGVFGLLKAPGLCFFAFFGVFVRTKGITCRLGGQTKIHDSAT